MVVAFKAIKPGRFNDAAMNKVLKSAVKEIGQEIKRDYEILVIGWDTKVKFTVLEQIGPNKVAVLVGTDEKIFKYVDEGTKPHKIKPRKRKALRWVDTQIRFAKSVKHPGFKGYHWTEKMTKEWQPKFKRHMEAAMKEAAQASGHSR